MNSLHFQEFFKNVQNNLLETQERNYLSRGSETHVFNNLVTNLKQNGIKHKSFQISAWGFGEEWKEELRHSKSRMPGVQCGCSCRTSLYAEAQLDPECGPCKRGRGKSLLIVSRHVDHRSAHCIANMLHGIHYTHTRIRKEYLFCQIISQTFPARTQLVSICPEPVASETNYIASKNATSTLLCVLMLLYMGGACWEDTYRGSSILLCVCE